MDMIASKPKFCSLHSDAWNDSILNRRRSALMVSIREAFDFTDEAEGGSHNFYHHRTILSWSSSVQ